MKIHVIIATMLVMGWSCLPLAAQDELEDDLFDEDGLVEFKYIPNPNRIRLKSTLTDDLAARLKAGESVTVRVPADQQQIISSMILRKPEFFKSKLLSTRPRTQIVDGNLLIPIPIQIVDRLDYQPIELKIYQSNVNRVTLIPVDDPDDQNSLTSKNLAPDFFVRLKPNNGVAVVFRNLNSFKLKNEWFEFEFPFAEIEGIFFDQDQTDQASVVLKNGDSVSGKHFWPDLVEFETPWGNEDIELDQVVAVTRDKSVELVLSGVENPKYILLRQNNQYTPRR